MKVYCDCDCVNQEDGFCQNGEIAISEDGFVVTTRKSRRIRKGVIWMKDKEIVKIAVENIYQHPDNPRKDLGDLSELSESNQKMAHCLPHDIHIHQYSFSSHLQYTETAHLPRTLNAAAQSQYHTG